MIHLWSEKFSAHGRVVMVTSRFVLVVWLTGRWTHFVVKELYGVLHRFYSHVQQDDLDTFRCFDKKPFCFAWPKCSCSYALVTSSGMFFRLSSFFVF